MVYGATADDAVVKVQALALRVMAERLEHESELGMTTARRIMDYPKGWAQAIAKYIVNAYLGDEALKDRIRHVFRKYQHKS